MFHLHSLIYSLMRKYIENLFAPGTVSGGRNSGKKNKFSIFKQLIIWEAGGGVP